MWSGTQISVAEIVIGGLTAIYETRPPVNPATVEVRCVTVFAGGFLPG